MDLFSNGFVMPERGYDVSGWNAILCLGFYNVNKKCEVKYSPYEILSSKMFLSY